MSRLAQLAQLAQEGTGVGEAELERCEMCGEPLAAEHRHLVDLSASRLLCACRACTLLFDRRAAGGGHFRLVPDRRLVVSGFRLEDEQWDALRIPVGLAFFFRSTRAERMVALYPGPVGATECLLELGAWAQIEAANPVLGQVEPDVEALLVNRTAAGPGCYVVPVDDCYALVGLMRMHWKGLNGGDRVWDELEAFFERIRRRSATVTYDGEEA
ncbi:MAG: DUF5947 family protein [Gaiellales bacterium]